MEVRRGSPMGMAVVLKTPPSERRPRGMGNALSVSTTAVSTQLRRLLEFFRRAFRSNRMAKNPTMEEMEGLMAKVRQEQDDMDSVGDTTGDEATVLDEPERTEESAQAQSSGPDERAELRDGAWETKQRRRTPINPPSIPTAAEYAAAKRRIQYKEGLLHIAITGVSGSGKSSLLNALLGLRNGVEGSAPVGTAETTETITRYPDPQPDNPFVYFDVPGAGTLRVPGWEYFLNQGLYVFDAVIIVVDNRVTEIDIGILRNCERMNIPTYLVRSKARQHIRNTMSDLDPGETRDRDVVRQVAREKYIGDTQDTVRRNLKEAGLPPQRVYIVDKEILWRIVSGEQMRYGDWFDEWAFLWAILSDARSRRLLDEDPNDYGDPCFPGSIEMVTM